MRPTDSTLRFGKEGLRAQDLSQEALWDEVRRRRRARGQSASFETGVSDPPRVVQPALSMGARTKHSVAQWYANLELEPGEPLSKVREAYDRLSHQFRPEQHKSDPEKYSAAKDLMRSLNHAYESLSAYLSRES